MPGRVRLTLPRLVSVQLRAVFVGSVTTWGVVVALLLAFISGAVAGVSALSSNQTDALATAGTAIAFASVPVQLLAITIGSDGLAGEFARGTIGATLSVVPKRGLLFAAKSLAAGGTVIGVGLIAGLIAGGSAMLIWMLPGRAVDSLVVAAWLASSGGLALGAGILAWVVFAIGALTRQRIAAVLVPIAVLYVAPLLVGVFASGATRDWLGAVLPSMALNALMAARINGDTVTVGLSIGTHAALTFWSALIVLAVWCVLVVPWAAATFLRWDLSATSRQSAHVLGGAARRAPSAGARQVVPLVGDRRSTAGGRFRSELRKSWSLPSVRWLFVVSVVIELGYGMLRALTGSIDSSGATPAEGLAVEYSYAITGGIGGIALILAVIASIQIAGEFETGTAIPTFIAAPRRWQVTVSKLMLAWLSAAVFALPSMLLTGLIVAPIYAGRGYTMTGAAVAEGATGALKALLFLLLTTSMSAGIAGLTRRSVATVLAVCVLLIVGPALLNTVLGFARQAHSPLVAVGNAARTLPWEGARFFYPPDGVTSFASVDSDGVLQVSASFGIVMTALWAVAAVAIWFVVDARRPITTR